jgi:Domain of unknown function DUF29
MPVPATQKSLYDEDFAAWAEEQAALLRAGRLTQLDAANIAEELEDMGRSDRRELRSRLEILLAHLLKQQQPELYETSRRSWDATINEQRRALRRLFKESPSLRRGLDAAMRETYEGATERAVDETGLPRDAFPAACPFTVEEALGEAAPTGGRSGRPQR